MHLAVKPPVVQEAARKRQTAAGFDRLARIRESQQDAIMPFRSGHSGGRPGWSDLQAVLCQTIGWGSSLQCSVHSSMASTRAGTLAKLPRRSRRSVSSLNQRSTRFSHDELVGVKCRCHRALRQPRLTPPPLGDPTDPVRSPLSETSPPPPHRVGIHPTTTSDLLIAHTIGRPQQRPGLDHRPVRQRRRPRHRHQCLTLFIRHGQRGGSHHSHTANPGPPDYFNDGPLAHRMSSTPAPNVHDRRRYRAPDKGGYVVRGWGSRIHRRPSVTGPFRRVVWDGHRSRALPVWGCPLVSRRRRQCHHGRSRHQLARGIVPRCVGRFQVLGRHGDVSQPAFQIGSDLDLAEG